MSDERLLLPVPSGPSPERPELNAPLPADLTDQAVHRLGLLAAVSTVIAGIEGLASHVPALFLEEAYPNAADRLDLAGMVSVVALSLLTFVLVRRRVASSERLIQLGYVYLVVLAFLLSCTDHADYFWQNGGSLYGLPASAVLIVSFPVLVPAAPARVLITALAMALTGPLSLFTLSWTLGYARPDAEALVESFPWVAALLASVLARIVQELGSELKRARTLGAYTLEERLGSGGMGDVYRARHRLLARPAAIKLIRPDPPPSPESRERFRREAIALSQLKSPHTVELYDFGVTSDGTFYYVMELLDGLDLDRFVERHGPLPAARVVYWLKQLCLSLREAHAAGLVHRDLKPGNVVVCRYGLDDDFIKLLDFGLVSFAAEFAREDPKLTAGGAIRGTPAFLAPELALSNDPVDGRADLYALGCIAYWLLTGRQLFEGRNALETIIAHVQEAPKPPSAFASAIPKELEALVLSCLQKSPDARPRDADTVLAALDACPLDRPWTAALAREWWQANGDAPRTPAPALYSAERAG